MTRPRPAGEEAVQDVQVMLKSDAHHASIRGLKVPIDFFTYLILIVIIEHLITSEHLITPPTVRAGVSSGEGARHHHLSHSSEGEGHQGVSAVSRLSCCPQQHPSASRPAGLRAATQMQHVSMTICFKHTVSRPPQAGHLQV